MKKLINVNDGKAILRIEAVRVTYEILSLSYEELSDKLSNINQNNATFRRAVLCLRNAWSFIDCAYRYGCVVSQIKGFRHKDPRFKKLEKHIKNVENIRNFIQHLNSAIPKAANDIYPISGALSWPSDNRKTSYTMSAGTLPSESQYHSLSFNYELGEFKGSVVFNLDSFELDLTETNNLINSCNEYLNEWLSNNKMLDSVDSNPNLLIADGLDKIAPPNGKKFGRVRFKAN